MTPYFAVMQGLVFTLASYFTLGFITHCFALLAHGIIHKSYRIPVFLLPSTAILWGIFFVMRIYS